MPAIRVFPIIAYIGLILVLPLLGVWLDGRPVAPYLEFPPRPSISEPAQFSWPIFLLIALLIALCLAPFLVRTIRANPEVPAKSLTPAHFPAFGWLGSAVTAIAWILAWNRFGWFAPYQPFTFTPLWIGYILVVNALSWRRGGQCLLVRRPRFLLALFPLSALFWWGFEYLNRFVANWHYLGVGQLGPWQYLIQVTPPFATVLPAVLSTIEWLETFPRLSQGLDRFGRVAAPPRPLFGAALLLAGAASLLGLGICPAYLFPLVWLAPILLITGLQTLAGFETPVLTALVTGNWRRLWLSALAGLICGFFWELWNSQSLAHWAYSIPYLGRFKLFEMPLLGYSGYLPFGILCMAFADCLNATRNRA